MDFVPSILRTLRSLKFRMTAVVVLLVLSATVIVASLALLLAEKDMKSVIGDQQFALLSSGAALIDSQLAAKRTLLATLADTMPEGLTRDPKGFADFIALHPTARAEFLNLVVYDREGRLLLTTATGIASAPQDPSRKAFYDAALASGRSLISAPFLSPTSKVPVVLVTQPVIDRQGHVTMVLAGSIDLAHAPFLDQIAAQRPGKTGFMFIMTTSGVLVQHPNRQRVLEHINARPGRNEATEMALNGFEGWTEALNKEGSEGIYAYKRLRSTDWILGARYPVDEAFAPMLELRSQSVLAAAVVAAVAGLVSWLVILQLMKPLARLRRNVSDIRSGKAEIGVLQRRRRDEIGELSTAFHVLMAEREAAQESIRDSELLVRNILERAPDAFVSCDNRGIINEWNAQAERTFGWTRAEAVGRDVADLIIPPALRGAHHGGMERFAANGTGPLVNTRVRLAALHRDGHQIPIELSIGALRHGSEHYATAFLHDVTERVLYEEKLAASEQRLIQLARVDTLTGIANRLKFDEVLQQAIVRSRRNRQPMALAYLDIDNFKTINDTLGHGAGDTVLKEFAQRLAATVRATDTVARLAGDEFVIVFEQVYSHEEAARLAAKVVEAVRDPMQVHGAPMRITTSIGVALRDDDAEEAAALVARADRALYAAKRNGRDGYALAGPAAERPE
jgi:diguanylate cyclase (GGDEF)-like protein/PAS domain S-box-containing protein